MTANKYRRSLAPTNYVAVCKKILRKGSRLTVGKTYRVWFYASMAEIPWIEIEDDEGRYVKFVVKNRMGEWFEVSEG